MTMQDDRAHCRSTHRPFTRRAAIQAAAGTFAILSIGARGAARLPPGLFSLGIASGDPTPDGVVLWTRLAPDPTAADGGMPPQAVPVRWEVAEDEGFRRIVQVGDTHALPAFAHAAHVEVAGLRPARRYWYRFIAGGEASPIGRTATSPARGAAVDRLRICFASCQNYESGYYSAYSHLVDEDPDLVFFLGDYIYEGAPTNDGVRRHVNPEPSDLNGYRIRYASYKSDPLLQAAHRAAPWVVTWDDHEVANDYGAALDQDNSDPLLFLRRRAAAYQAYYEHQPLRRASRPRAGGLRLHRTLDWGGLAQFQIVDDRQFRASRACQPPALAEAHKRNLPLVQPCPELLEANRSMLGKAQERWLMHALGESRAQWNVLAQQTLMHDQRRIDPKHPENGPLVPVDTWSGYPVARDRIFRRWVEAATPNPLAIGGDIHAFAAADVRDPARPDGPPIASELVGGSITSLLRDPEFKAQAAADGMLFAENERRGYGRIDFDRHAAAITFRAIKDARQLGSPISDLARFTVEHGRPGLMTS